MSGMIIITIMIFIGKRITIIITTKILISAILMMIMSPQL